MLKSVFISLFLFLCNSLYAIPTRRLVVLSQKDGTTINAYLVGDEYFHYHMTEDAIPILQSNDGGWYYANINNNEFFPSEMMAHNECQRSGIETQFLKDNYTETKRQSLNRQINLFGKTNRSTIRKITQKRNRTDYIGRKKGLVILVNFANQVFAAQNAQYDYYRMFNEKGYNDNNHVGSVHDYFYDQSYGKLDLDFDIIGPVSLSNNYSFYGGNNVAGQDKNPQAMVREACCLVDDIVDFRQYDWNNDGEVDQVYIIYAGYGEASGGIASTIWPHESYLQYHKDGVLVLDGITINQYACSNELDGNSGSIMRGIGTACHEFSHCLGFPDVYDTDYSGAFGMNGYDLMDSGGHSGPNGLGEVPYGFTAFERWYAGWMEITELPTEYRVDNLFCLNSFPTAYKIVNENYPNEYFIIENHQNKKWFSYIGSSEAPHGMMITHIDYDENAWRLNQVNPNKYHQRMSIIPADNSYGEYISSSKHYYLSQDEIKGDFFPGLRNIVRMSSASHKETGGELFNENVGNSKWMNVIIDNIQENNEIISFTTGNIQVPSIVNAYKNNNIIVVSWSSIKEAETYSLELVGIISLFPRKFETLTIDDIKETNYTFKDINYPQCTVRVRCKNEFASSEWSEYTKAIEDPDGIEYIETDENQNYELYSIDGLKVLKLHNRGIYIQKENGQTKKIYIR